MSKKNVLTQSRKKKALALLQANRLDEARTAYLQIATLDKMDAEVWFYLGAINGQLANPEESEECFRRAVAISPGYALAHYNLGMSLRLRGEFEGAVHALREAVRLQPDRPEILEGLAHTYTDMGQPTGAAECYQSLLKFKPHDAETHFNLGMMRYLEGRLTEAIAHYRQALKLNPAAASVHDNLGSALCNQGFYAEASACHQQASALKPDDEKFYSNLLMTRLYQQEASPQALLDEYRAWGSRFSVAPSGWLPHDNSRDTARRLRVGYVSPDFRSHAVAYFFEPLLEHHDASSVEAICYSTSAKTDAVTARLRSMASEWRDISKLSDDEAERLIRSDKVDILVDLAGHTALNRLRLFGRKPAPVQVTYLGYPDTTGLEAVDYRFTDALADPPGQDAWHTESLARLPGCFLCYRPLPEAPEVAPIPAQEKGYVTFGSFNNLSKVNERVVALWAELLRSVPNSRLFIKSPPLTDEGTRQRYHGLFEAQGIGRDRVDLIGRMATQAEHLDLYKCLDIALDTFPYNGTTTTCEALWMGVPVITLVGARHSGRVGVSLLNAVGLADWIAETPEQYVSLAAQMGADIPRLAGLRAGMRSRMAASPLCDGKAFALKVEAAYREVWRKYCAS